MNSNELKIKVVSDSSCDIAAPGDGEIFTAPLTISADGRDFIDDVNLDVHEMLDFLEKSKGRSFSACPNVEMWLKAFGDADVIYCIAMTSAISGTYNAACAARDIYLQEHPNAKVYVKDTLSTGPEQRLIAEKALELAKAKVPFEEACAEIEKYSSKTRLFFTLASLHNLAQNGRVSKIVASAVGILSMKIVCTASSEGTLETLGKHRGEKKAKTAILEHMKEAGYMGGKVAICHVENPSFAEEVKNAILERFPKAGILVYPTRGLCGYYAERGGLLVGCEC